MTCRVGKRAYFKCQNPQQPDGSGAESYVWDSGVGTAFELTLYENLNCPGGVGQIATGVDTACAISGFGPYSFSITPAA